MDRRAGVQRDFSNWAPRFGFAYQAANNTVIRGGYGLFYNPNGNGGALLRLFRHVPFGPIYSVVPGDNFVGSRVSDGFPDPPTVNFAAAKNPSGGVIGVAPNFRSAYAQQYNLTIEHEVTPWQTMFKVAYVGNLGRRLGTTYDLNQPTPSPIGTVNERRPFYRINPNIVGITYAVSDGLSAYHALQFSIEKRYSHGLALQTGYTWSHSIDNVANDFGGGSGTPQDIRCRRPCERGNSSFDIRHRLTIAGTYELPFARGKGLTHTFVGGWKINANAMVQTGLPFNLGLNNPANTNGAGGAVLTGSVAASWPQTSVAFRNGSTQPRLRSPRMEYSAMLLVMFFTGPVERTSMRRCLKTSRSPNNLNSSSVRNSSTCSIIRNSGNPTERFSTLV